MKSEVKERVMKTYAGSSAGGEDLNVPSPIVLIKKNKVGPRHNVCSRSLA